MNLFVWMITGHLIGDFLLQTNWMASNKIQNPVVLVIHSGVYTVAVSLMALISGGLHWYTILFLFVSHILLDNRSFILWWCNHITKSTEMPWLVVAADQSWHVVVLAASCMLNGG